MHFALVQSLLGDGLHDLLPAAAEFGEIKFSLRLAQFAIAAFLDSVRKVLGDLPFETSQEEWAQFGGEATPGDALGSLGVFLHARFISLMEMFLRPKVTGMHKIGDAPEV